MNHMMILLRDIRTRTLLYADDMITPEHPAVHRALARTTPTDSGCWEWDGPTDRRGYPTGTSVDGVRWVRYRLVCAAYHGPIPDGYEVDHVCTNNACLNPDHLEAVTPAENMRRRYALITHCPRDHEYTPENTRWDTRRSGRDAGGKTRHCRKCEAARQRARRAALSSGERTSEDQRRSERRHQAASS
jgi:hypothetical protein